MNDIIWKAVKGFEGFYEVSNNGQVRRVSTGRILKQFKNNKGYLRVSLSRGGVYKSYSVHRLVADAFIPNPDNLPTINHVSEDKTDNSVSNLNWMSVEDNINYGTAQERKSEAWRIKREEKLTWATDPNEIEDIKKSQKLAENSRRYYWKKKLSH